MFANVVTAISSSTAITLGLFYIMHLLIAMQPGAIVDQASYAPIIFTRIKKPEDPAVVTTPPIERLPAPTPPIIPDMGADTGVPAINVPRTPVPTPTPKTEGVIGAWNDGPLVSMVKVQPVYPTRASQDGIEGYVIVQFDVNADGGVSDVSIVESSHRLFEKSAVNAALKFRFKPRVVDGVAHPTTGIRNLFRYEMEQ